MRLTPQEIATIKSLVRYHFGNDAIVYLFGSRVLDTKKGGDIDLLIETPQQNLTQISQSELYFLGDLQTHLGEQKIDLIINHPGLKALPKIISIALKTGIQL